MVYPWKRYTDNVVPSSFTYHENGFLSIQCLRGVLKENICKIFTVIIIISWCNQGKYETDIIIRP